MTLCMLNIPLKTTAARIKSGFGVSVHKTKRVCQPWTLSILILIKLPMKPQVKPLASSRLAGLGCVCVSTDSLGKTIWGTGRSDQRRGGGHHLPVALGLNSLEGSSAVQSRSLTAANDSIRKGPLFLTWGSGPLIHDISRKHTFKVHFHRNAVSAKGKNGHIVQV